MKEEKKEARKEQKNGRTNERTNERRNERRFMKKERKVYQIKKGGRIVKEGRTEGTFTDVGYKALDNVPFPSLTPSFFLSLPSFLPNFPPPFLPPFVGDSESGGRKVYERRKKGL